MEGRVVASRESAEQYTVLRRLLSPRNGKFVLSSLASRMHTKSLVDLILELNLLLNLVLLNFSTYSVGINTY
eukprot:SAG11_NODE_5898_length_1437_cov_11.166667_2_plen_72_part_00